MMDTMCAIHRLHELEDGTDPVDVTSPSTVPHTSPTHPQQVPPAPVEVEILPAEPPPTLGELSPILPVRKLDTQGLETTLRLESRIIELQGKNKESARTKKHLKSQLSALEQSQLQDQDTICSMQQQIHDLEENGKLYHERFSQLLAAPPLVQVGC